MKEKELLDVLADSHQMFISDLPAHLPMLARDIRAIPASQFPVEEWNETASYLFHTPVNCQSAEEAREVLISGILS